MKPGNSTADAHVARLTQIAEEVSSIQNQAAGREYTPAEQAKLAALNDEFTATELAVKATAITDRAQAHLAEPLPRRSMPADATEPRRPYSTFSGGVPAGRGTFNFPSMGAWASAALATKRGRGDPRILNAPTTFGQEGINPDGGFAVPPDFRTQIMKQVLSEDSLLGMCDQQVTSSNSITIPLDSTTPWQTSGGVLAGWSGEGAALAQSKPKLDQAEVKLNKLTALVPLTDEMVSDVPSMTAWLNSKVPEKFTSILNDAIINGDAIGKPEGILTSGAKIAVAAVGGQGAGTVVYSNITSMWSRMYGPNRRRAVWLINQDVEPQLQQLTVPGSLPFPAYLQPGGLSGQPYASLMGRPVFTIEACQTLGTEGDIILADLSQYLAALKSDGIRSDVSIHLYFDTDHTAFRFIMRVGGQSYWSKPITRKNGTNTLSPFVTLSGSRT